MIAVLKTRDAAHSKGFPDLLQDGKNAGNPEKWHKNQKKQQETCGNRAFAVDKGREKTQGKRR